MMTREQFMSLTDQQKWDALLLAESERDDFERQLAEMRPTTQATDFVHRTPMYEVIDSPANAGTRRLQDWLQEQLKIRTYEDIMAEVAAAVTKATSPDYRKQFLP